MVDHADQFGLEAAGVFGPFSVQGEYQTADFDGANDGASDVDTGGYYVQASYILTGESRGYTGKAGKFDKVRPKGRVPGNWLLNMRMGRCILKMRKMKPSTTRL